MLTQHITNENTIITRKRKSEAMTPEEHEAFKSWVNKQPTKLDAALTLLISRGALDDILSKGSGKPENIERIRSIINIAA